MEADEPNSIFDNNLSNYFELNGFEFIFLEDSFVLEISDSSALTTFLLELVLTQKHPLYEKPKKGEVHCWKKAQVYFPEKKDIIWIEKIMFPYRDPNGEIDFGNIDFFFRRNNMYYLSGDWGKIVIESAEPTIKFLEE